MKLLVLALSAATLTAPAAATAQTTAPATAKPATTDPMKCRRMPVTGSLARTKKVCMSEAEWRQAREDAMRLGDEKICNGPSCNGQPGP